MHAATLQTVATSTITAATIDVLVTSDVSGGQILKSKVKTLKTEGEMKVNNLASMPLQLGVDGLSCLIVAEYQRTRTCLMATRQQELQRQQLEQMTISRVKIIWRVSVCVTDRESVEGELSRTQQPRSQNLSETFFWEFRRYSF